MKLRPCTILNDNPVRTAVPEASMPSGPGSPTSLHFGAMTASEGLVMLEVAPEDFWHIQPHLCRIVSILVMLEVAPEALLRCRQWPGNYQFQSLLCWK